MRRSRLERLRGRMRRIRAWTTYATEDVWFYNLDNYRSDSQVQREIRAIAQGRPAAIGLCEVIGNEIPTLDGYRLVRDESTRSRFNIAAYFRDDLPVRSTDWIDLIETWGRTEHPGLHEARSYLVCTLGRMQFLVAHQPPKGTDNVQKAQEEGIDALTGIMAPWTRRDWRKRPRPAKVLARWRPRMLVWDANRRSGESGPGPDVLARRIGGRVRGGDRIDNAVTRNVSVRSIEKFSRVNGVRLESDHGGAIRVRIRLLRGWLS